MSRFTARLAGHVICATALVLGACDNLPVEPSDETIRLTGQISQTVIAPGQTATLTFRLENLSDESVTLRFNSGCQILPYIATRPDGPIVYPPGGGWACAAVISELTLRPRAASTHEVIVQASLIPPPPRVGLSPGEYAAYGKVEAVGFDTQSASVSFTVQ